MTPEDIRAVALSLPEAVEQPHFEKTSFRVRGKIFATVTPDGARLWLKLPEEIKATLKESDPAAILPLPGACDRGGSTLIEVARMDAAKLADLVRLAWRQVAPKRLHGAGDDRT
jgi:hypothetical protein